MKKGRNRGPPRTKQNANWGRNGGNQMPGREQRSAGIGIRNQALTRRSNSEKSLERKRDQMGGRCRFRTAPDSVSNQEKPAFCGQREVLPNGRGEGASYVREQPISRYRFIDERGKSPTGQGPMGNPEGRTGV